MKRLIVKRLIALSVLFFECRFHRFEVFDEKWKGGEHPNEVEKHWGLFYSDRSPKESMRMIDNK